MPSDKFPQSKTGKQHENTTARLSETEIMILEQVTEADKNKLKDWHKAKLVKGKDQIVPIRSEDLLYFLECVHQGYIPVGTSTIRSKGGDVNDFSVTPNPESKEIKRHPELLQPKGPKRFVEAVNTNSLLYSHTARIQRIYRNIITPHVDPEDLKRIVCEFYETDTSDNDLAGKTEDYFDVLEQETKTAQKHCFNLKNAKPALFLLGEYLRSKKVDIEPLEDFLINSQDRGSICLAFNNNLVKNYEATAEKDSTDSHDEFVLKIPDGKLSLDTVYGFEALGDFEDAVLDKLGV